MHVGDMQFASVEHAEPAELTLVVMVNIHASFYVCHMHGGNMLV